MFNKRNFIIGLILLILLAGGVYIWFLKKAGPSALSPGEQAKITRAELIKKLQDYQARGDALDNILKTDGDLDGITDADEAKIGTNPRSPDTDGDGLRDSDEIDIYKTDPLKKDTYGIGNTDGGGVVSGKILPGGQVKK